MKKMNLLNRIVNGITANVFNQGSNLITNYLTSYFIYKVDLRVIDYTIKPALEKLFPHMNTRAMTFSSYNNDDLIEFTPLVDSNIGNFVDVTVYKGMTVVIIINNNNKQGGNGVKGISDRAQTDSYLCCVRTPENIALMHELINKMVNYGLEEERKRGTKIRIWKSEGDQSSMHYSDKKLRTFNDVFIPSNQFREIKYSIDKFMKKRDWYYNNNIANHFGILLYGAPSSGKSSIAQAIADYMNADLYVINGDDVMELPNIIDKQISMYSRTCRYRVILIEDIDTGIIDKRTDDDSVVIDTTSAIDKGTKKSRSSSGLGSLLNCLDGLDAPNDVVFIFTTNHVNKLDPALIRPGRIDLKLEIKLACKETFKEFIKYHFGQDKELPKNFEIKDNVSFAALQTLIMKECTFDEVIAYAKK